MAVDQIWAARPLNSRTVSPCTGRLVVWESLAAVSTARILGDCGGVALSGTLMLRIIVEI